MKSNESSNPIKRRNINLHVLLVSLLILLLYTPCQGQVKSKQKLIYHPEIKVPQRSFSLIILPDIQYYTAYFPGILDQQMEWIVANKRALNIKYVVNMGDLTDDNNISHWENASSSFKILEQAGIPYAIVQGNHDLRIPDDDEGENYDGIRHNEYLNRFFPTSRFENATWWKGGFFDQGRIENYYCTFEYQKKRFMIMNLEYAPRDAVLSWANRITGEDNTRKTIVVTHGFMDKDGSRDIQPFNIADHNQGQAIWDEYVRSHSNIMMLLCGHYNGVLQLENAGDQGNRIPQILTDYQMDGLNGSNEEIARCGNGWLRILTFFPDKDSVSIRPVCAFWGGIGEKKTGYDWSENWTTAEFFNTGASKYLFLLKESNGVVHIHKVNNDGTIGDRTDTRDWSDDWTSAKFYTAGNQTYLFLLKKRDGTVHIHKMNSNGTVGTMIKEYDWSDGWSVIRPFTIGSNPFLFMLKTSDGTVHIHKIKSNGTIGDRVDTRDWSEGWSGAEFYTSGNSTYLLLLKKSDGVIHVHHMNIDGTVGSMIDEKNWTGGYSIAETYKVRGRNFLLIGKTNGYANDRRNVHIHTINDDGTIGIKLAGYRWTEGWTLMKPFYSLQGPRLFMLKENGDASDGMNVHLHYIMERGYDHFFNPDYPSDKNLRMHTDRLFVEN